MKTFGLNTPMFTYSAAVAVARVLADATGEILYVGSGGGSRDSFFGVWTELELEQVSERGDWVHLEEKVRPQ